MKVKWIWYTVGFFLSAACWAALLTGLIDKYPGTFALIGLTGAGIMLGWLARYWDAKIWR